MMDTNGKVTVVFPGAVGTKIRKNSGGEIEAAEGSASIRSLNTAKWQLEKSLIAYQDPLTGDDQG
jgi:hypothetical protein